MLPRTGGIVQRAPYELIGNPEQMKKGAVEPSAVA